MPKIRRKYRLRLERNGQDRFAIYEPEQGRLFWEDSQEKIIVPKRRARSAIPPAAQISPESPGRKTSNLKLIKLQVGFGCNFSCSYCSQKTFRPTALLGAKTDARDFIDRMQNWFDGGEDGRGAGVRLEFWGGETLIYWKLVRELAVAVRDKYPNIAMLLFTNGSLLTDEMIDSARILKIQFVLSHDGLGHERYRGKDPFKEPKTKELIRRMCRELLPEKLFSVNMTVNKDNFGLAENKNYIAAALGVPPDRLPVNFEVLFPFDQTTLKMVVQDESESNRFTNDVFSELAHQPVTESLSFGHVALDLLQFTKNLWGDISTESMSQKCRMDTPEAIAVDLQGNVLTCQNTTAKGGHKIGHVDDLAGVRLNTAYHWSQRESCQKCPVLEMCRGSCMHLKGDLFEGACDNFFSYYLGVLAFALHELVGMKLIEIQGADLRGRGEASVAVLQHRRPSRRQQPKVSLEARP